MDIRIPSRAELHVAAAEAAELAKKVRDRAAKLGVLGISPTGAENGDDLSAMNTTLDIIEKNKDWLDAAAGELPFPGKKNGR